MTFEDTNKANVRATLELALPQTLTFVQRGGMVLIGGRNAHTPGDQAWVLAGGEIYMHTGTIGFLGVGKDLQISLTSNSQADRFQVEDAIRHAVQPTGKRIKSMEFAN